MKNNFFDKLQAFFLNTPERNEEINNANAIYNDNAYIESLITNSQDISGGLGAKFCYDIKD